MPLFCEEDRQKSLAILAYKYSIHHFNSVTRSGKNSLYDRESIWNNFTVATDWRTRTTYIKTFIHKIGIGYDVVKGTA